MSDDYQSQLEELKAKILHYHPQDDIGLVERAFFFAQDAHKDVMRKSGKPYFTHPLRVAFILADLMMDSTTCAAGLLHDVVEDTDITLAVITEKFGSEVALMVDGVTKLSKLDFTSKEEQQAESLRKMFMAMAKDIRVVIIKLADRLHNMRTLKFQRPDRQVAIAKETLDVYAPLAHRLGMFAIKWELEDLSLRYIEPAIYYDLVEKVGMKRTEREATIRQVISILREKLQEQGIKAEIEGRPKHFYSIYRKMYLQHKEFDQIYDLIATRVIVDTVPECYAVLGTVHTLWAQVPGRFKDYISVPKQNMYQALHTTVVGLGGQTFEVQIKTHEMHNTAEYGIAAHWRYKEGKSAGDLDDKLYWLRQILDWQDDTKDASEFMQSLKVDLFADEVFVFTPKGKVISLPKGATPLDFAYRIHSEIGNKCVGAKVNGRIVPLDSKLETGDFVEVLTSQGSKGPKLDWMNIVKTSEARAKIRAFFKRELKDEHMERGREMLEKEARRQGYTIAQLIRPDNTEMIRNKYSLNVIDDLYAAIGFGGISVNHVMTRLVEDYKRYQQKMNPTPPPAPQELAAPPAARQPQQSSNGVFVKGEPGMLVRFARCCSPLPGDEIIGYITRGRGVSVHRADCLNVREIVENEPERLVDVAWAGDATGNFSAEIQIIAYDHAGLLADLSLLFSQIEVPILSISARTNARSGASAANATTSINLTIETRNTLQLDKVIRQLKKRSDVIEVYRVST
ncbi:MAG: RelA/SpoT family protein [Candidatus Fimadaptatus sp.]